MADFTPVTALSSELGSTPVNGQFIYVTDRGELYIDLEGVRSHVGDITSGTYSAITELLTPLTNKLYFATDTHEFLQATYTGNTVTWHTLCKGGASVPQSQGVANAGKFLTVGNDGNVTLTSLPLYSGTVE